MSNRAIKVSKELETQEEVNYGWFHMIDYDRSFFASKGYNVKEVTVHTCTHQSVWDLCSCRKKTYPQIIPKKYGIDTSCKLKVFV